jgi:hypothetical protein
LQEFGYREHVIGHHQCRKVHTSHLLYTLDTAFHTLYGYKFARLDALRFQHLGEGPFALLREHTILYIHTHTHTSLAMREFEMRVSLRNVQAPVHLSLMQFLVSLSLISFQDKSSGRVLIRERWRRLLLLHIAGTLWKVDSGCFLKLELPTSEFQIHQMNTVLLPLQQTLNMVAASRVAILQYWKITPKRKHVSTS